jgi:hypothetical protein
LIHNKQLLNPVLGSIPSVWRNKNFNMGKWLDDREDSYLDNNAITHYFNDTQMLFLEKVKSMTLEDKLYLLDITAADCVGFFDGEKYQAELTLLYLFKKKYQWLETGEAYDFDDADVNFDLFGVELTKKQIKGRLKRKSFNLDDLLKMKTFFETTNDLEEIE